MKQDDEFIGKIRQVLGGDLSLLNKREMVELNKRAKNYIEAVEREAVKLNNKRWIEEIKGFGTTEVWEKEDKDNYMAYLVPTEFLKMEGK